MTSLPQHRRPLRKQKKNERTVLRPGNLRDGIDHADGTLQGASLSQYSLPQLYADDPEDEEHEEAEQQDIAKHGQGVQQEHHQDTHACQMVRG